LFAPTLPRIREQVAALADQLEHDLKQALEKSGEDVFEHHRRFLVPAQKKKTFCAAMELPQKVSIL
jgi:hypothetical protein